MAQTLIPIQPEHQAQLARLEHVLEYLRTELLAAQDQLIALLVEHYGIDHRNWMLDSDHGVIVVDEPDPAAGRRFDDELLAGTFVFDEPVAGDELVAGTFPVGGGEPAQE